MSQSYILRFLLISLLYLPFYIVSSSAKGQVATDETEFVSDEDDSLKEWLVKIDSGAKDHIAILLPTYSASLTKISASTTEGIFLARAADKKTLLPIANYSLDYDSIDKLQVTYEKAVQRGAKAIIGPLTKKAVKKLTTANLNFVPTLCLNVVPEAEKIDKNLFLFGLQIENEAKKLAKLAFSEGGRKILTVAENSSVYQRFLRSVEDEWLSQSGEIIAQLAYADLIDDMSLINRLLEDTEADTILIAVSPDAARNLRPYLGTRLPIYAPSIIHTSRIDKLRMHDLEEVRFLEMPWIIDKKSKFVTDGGEGKSLQLERFYALGIDAYEMTSIIVSDPLNIPNTIQGRSGIITFSNPLFIRDGKPAKFTGGNIKPIATFNDK